MFKLVMFWEMLSAVVGKNDDSRVLSLQEERSRDPQVVRAEERWGGSLAVDALPFSHFHHRILQPLERGENFREGNT